MIGIIGAMEIEVKNLVSAMTESKKTETKTKPNKNSYSEYKPKKTDMIHVPNFFMRFDILTNRMKVTDLIRREKSVLFSAFWPLPPYCSEQVSCRLN